MIASQTWFVHRMWMSFTKHAYKPMDTFLDTYYILFLTSFSDCLQFFQSKDTNIITQSLLLFEILDSHDYWFKTPLQSFDESARFGNLDFLFRPSEKCWVEPFEGSSLNTFFATKILKCILVAMKVQQVCLEKAHPHLTVITNNVTVSFHRWPQKTYMRNVEILYYFISISSKLVKNK